MHDKITLIYLTSTNVIEVRNYLMLDNYIGALQKLALLRDTIFIACIVFKVGQIIWVDQDL